MKRKDLLLYFLGIILAGFLLLTAAIHLFPYSYIDREFSEEVQEHAHPVLDAIMKGISWFGYVPVSIIMAIVISLLFYVFKFKREALFMLLTLLSGVVSAATKILIDRPRPTEELVRIVEIAKTKSFPSGHVLFYVVFFGFLTFLMFQLKSVPAILRIMTGIFSLFLIFTVPFSRIYLGAHWFTDVVGGYLIGIVLLGILALFYLKGKSKRV
jgi:undecaprenyl-diphosphatase